MPMATYRICVIPGDGIGQEVTPQAVRVLEAAASRHGFRLECDREPWGSAYYAEHGLMMPEDGHRTVAAADATLFGAVGSPEVPDTVSAWGLILSLRQQLELYVNLRPVRAVPGPVPGRPTHRRLAMVIVRENTEGEYVGARRPAVRRHRPARPPPTPPSSPGAASSGSSSTHSAPCPLAACSPA